ncbi:ATP-binding protein [Undibacterium sp. TJN25]|uniref:ATP-binding protein n=1 Tax=Undibacterium sp. TJN25 TaxID=3413056 RepID=UPI003BF33E60
MQIRILTVGINSEQDVVTVRQRAREISGRLGFGLQDQVRVATAVSEVARDSYLKVGGARATFAFEQAGTIRQLVVSVRDNGSGYRAPSAQQDTLPGFPVNLSLTNAAVENPAIVAAHRLMDVCTSLEEPGAGTVVVLRKNLAASMVVDIDKIASLGSRLADTPASSTFAEIQQQNQELAATLAELRERQDDLMSLTKELEDTNRGVLALYAEIEEKAERLREADETKSRFLSNTSHELRTPLGSIRAIAQILLDRMDGELTLEQERQVQFIAGAANNLSDLVNDLLDLAKIEAGKEDVQCADIHIEELFSALKGMLRPLKVNPDVELVFSDAQLLPPFLSDEGKVAQILRNFISNALKFTEHGSVRVSAVVNHAEATICFYVVDTGIGIAPDDFSLVFEEFGQVEHPIQGRVKGTGLGLPLCRKLARLLQGEVKLTSTVGVGSIFSLILPLSYKNQAV